MSEKTVLLITPDPHTTQTFLLLLSKPESPPLRWTRRLDAGLRAIDREGPFAAVLLDLELGQQALRLVRSRAGAAPVLVITAPGEEARGRLAVASGACGFQVKGRLAQPRLPRAIAAVSVGLP